MFTNVVRYSVQFEVCKELALFEILCTLSPLAPIKGARLSSPAVSLALFHSCSISCTLSLLSPAVHLNQLKAANSRKNARDLTANLPSHSVSGDNRHLMHLPPAFSPVLSLCRLCRRFTRSLVHSASHRAFPLEVRRGLFNTHKNTRIDFAKDVPLTVTGAMLHFHFKKQTTFQCIQNTFAAF